MEKEQIQTLIREAEQAGKAAYAPYSDFMVGAALLAASGKVYTGCNIENSSYPAGICAERTAVSKAVSEGEKEYLAMAIVGRFRGKNAETYCYPCGICRQVLAEFCREEFLVISAKNEEEYQTMMLGELLPHAFLLDEQK